MKMKEKKVEEVVEENVNEQVLDYLKYARQAERQVGYGLGKIKYLNVKYGLSDCTYKSVGVDDDVTITHFSNENVIEKTFELLNEWIDEYNKVNFSKLDNFTSDIVRAAAPAVNTLGMLKGILDYKEKHGLEETEKKFFRGCE